MKNIVAQEAWATLEELRHLEDLLRVMPADGVQKASLEALAATIRLLELGMAISGAHETRTLEQPWWLEWQARTATSAPPASRRGGQAGDEAA